MLHEPSLAVDVSPDAIKAIAGGTQHACALFVDSSVSCWGSNTYGQLGYGDTNIHFVPGPAIDCGAEVGQITEGNIVTCVLFDEPAVSCWGQGQYGALGYGDVLDKLEPGEPICSVSTSQPGSG